MSMVKNTLSPLPVDLPEVAEVNAYDGERDRIGVVIAKRPVIGDGIFERTEAILIATHWQQTHSPPSD